MADVTSTFAAKDVGFTSTVNRMQRTLAGFQGGIASFAAKAAGLVTAFVGVQQSMAAFNNALSMGGRLDDLSKTTGATAGELLLLEKAFELAGSSADAVGPAIARLNRFMVEANTGSKSQIETLDRLGLSYERLQGLTPTEQMRLLARSIMALPTPAERTAAAMDIFGRSGSTLIPLFANFSGELDKAQGYLGSLPGLLDQSAGAMADMEDDIGALSDKFNQFVAGMVAGAAGADNFASALATIDAAGFGKDFGDSLRVAFDAPLETAKGIGYTLLTGVAEVNNLLDAGFRMARDIFIDMFSNDGLYQGFENVLTGIFAKVGEVFVGGLAEGLKSVIGIMDWNPLWRPFVNLAKGAISDLQEDIADAGLAASVSIDHGMTQMKAAYNAAQLRSEFIKRDTYDVAGYAEKAAESFMAAQEASRAIRANSAETSSNFQKGSEALQGALERIRGFDLTGATDSQPRPDWTQSAEPPPSFAPAAAAEPASVRRAAPTGGSSAAPQTNLDRLRIAAETDARARAELMRLQNEQTRGMNRAGDLRERGMFGAAARAEIRAERRAENRADRIAARNAAIDRFGGRNMGEAFRNFREDMAKSGEFSAVKQKDFEKWAMEQAKTEKERQAAEESATKSGPAAGSKKSENDMQSLLAKLIKYVVEDDRLPQHAMS